MTFICVQSGVVISSRESLILIVHICVHDQCTIESGASQVGIRADCLQESPFHTPWPKSSLDIAKLLLTWLCALRAHVAIGWYQDLLLLDLYSGILNSLLFGLNDFAKKTNFRFSQVLSPGEPLTSDDRLLHQKIPKILSDVLSRLCAHHLCHS